jgi:hypothetical protein
MDVRSPDTYKMEMLVDELPKVMPDEIEQAIQASLEEEWKQIEICSVEWDSFQEMLNHLKRIGNYDKDVKQVYELLSVYLYKYSYRIYESLSEDAYQYINTHLKGIRLRDFDKEKLTQILNRLRYDP